MTQQIQIFGQRCSGTNYLEQSLLANFENIEIVNHYGFKHIWNANLRKEIREEDNIKIIIIVRNPYNWLRSIHREPHHCPQLMGLSFDKFILSPWVAYSKAAWNSADPKIRLKNIDKAPIIEEFENVIEMRNEKNFVFNNILQDFPEKACLINYEKLNSDFESTLSYIKDFHKLSNKNDKLSHVLTYKKTGEVYKPKKLIKIQAKTKQHIDGKLRFNIENLLGYETDDYHYSSRYDFRLWRFKIKQFLVSHNLYKEKLSYSLDELLVEDIKKEIKFIWKKYGRLENDKTLLKSNLLNEILKRDPYHLPALLKKGILLKKEGDYNLAIKHFNLIIERDKSNHSAFHHKGVCLKQLGLIEQAVNNFKSANLLRPQWEPPIKHLKQIRAKYGDVHIDNQPQKL